MACPILSNPVFFEQDLCADVIEVLASVGKLTLEVAHSNQAVAELCKFVALSERMASDPALSRQIRRWLRTNAAQPTETTAPTTPTSEVEAKKAAMEDAKKNGRAK